MNKALIKKYKPEFDHWLNGGSVLIKSDLGWCQIAKEFEWSHDQPISSLLVINDEYVELRKALAKGKTIELNGTAINGGYGETWNDCSKEDLFIWGINAYRIKPIELKLGDYVKLTSTTHVATRTYPSWFQIDGKAITLHGSYINIEKGPHSFYFNELELWQPKPNEWCWFWDVNSNRHASIGQFKKTYKDKFKSFTCVWNYCAPFIGELPPHLKD